MCILIPGENGSALSVDAEKFMTSFSVALGSLLVWRKFSLAVEPLKWDIFPPKYFISAVIILSLYEARFSIPKQF